MTDNEIIKALECCINNATCSEECPYYIFNECLDWRKEATIKLINRQKTEIERLKHYCFGMQNELEAYKDVFNTAIAEAKSEAIKEFAERLKEKTDNPSKAMFNVYEFYGETIEKIVKEITGEKDND